MEDPPQRESSRGLLRHRGDCLLIISCCDVLESFFGINRKSCLFTCQLSVSRAITKGHFIASCAT